MGLYTYSGLRLLVCTWTGMRRAGDAQITPVRLRWGYARRTFRAPVKPSGTACSPATLSRDIVDTATESHHLVSACCPCSCRFRPFRLRFNSCGFRSADSSRFRGFGYRFWPGYRCTSPWFPIQAVSDSSGLVVDSVSDLQMKTWEAEVQNGSM